MPNLFIAGGACAHGFKFLPNIGLYVVQMLEGELASKYASAWRWRPDQQIVQDTSRPDVPAVSLDLSRLTLFNTDYSLQMDLSQVEGWKMQRMTRL